MSASGEDSLANASLESLASVRLDDFEPSVTIGRHPSCPIQCDWRDGPPDVCLMVSKRHATITVTFDAFFIKDEGSYNGLYVNWQRVPQQVQQILNPGDIICLGPRFFYSVTNATNRLCNPFVFQFRRSVEETAGIPVLVCNRLLNTPGSTPGPRIHLHRPVRPLPLPLPLMEPGTSFPRTNTPPSLHQSTPFSMPSQGTMVSSPSAPTPPPPYSGWPGVSMPPLPPRVVLPLGEGSSSEGPRFTPVPPPVPSPPPLPPSDAFPPAASLSTANLQQAAERRGEQRWGLEEPMQGRNGSQGPVEEEGGGEVGGQSGELLNRGGLASAEFNVYEDARVATTHGAAGATVANVEGSGSGGQQGGASAVGRKREREDAVTMGKRPKADDGAGPSSPAWSDEDDSDGTPHNLKWMKDEMMCPVCYNWLLYSHTLACSHTFCGDCIFQWLEAGQGAPKTCPVCRVKVTSPPVHLRLFDTIVEKVSADAHKADPELSQGRESRRTAFAATMKERSAALEVRFKRQDMQERNRGGSVMAPTGHGPRPVTNTFLITHAGRLTRLIPDQMFPRRQRNYAIDVAPNNDSQCTTCRQRICEGKLRLAPVEDLDRGPRRPHWYHFGCLVGRNEVRLDTLQGVNQLPPLLQNRVVDMIQRAATHHAPSIRGRRGRTAQPPVLPLPTV